MSKPIFILHSPKELCSDPNDTAKKIREGLKDEYHVMVVTNDSFQEPTYQCFNDCKGLPDIDIEKLIKDYQDGKAY